MHAVAGVSCAIRDGACRPGAPLVVRNDLRRVIGLINALALSCSQELFRTCRVAFSFIKGSNLLVDVLGAAKRRLPALSIG